MAVRCVEERIAVFSPHTSWDAVHGGINNWLLQPYGPGQVSHNSEYCQIVALFPAQATPVTHSTARSHPGGFSHTVTISGTAVGTDQLQVLGYFLDISTLIHYPHPFIQFLQAVLCLPDISVSVDASAITINCSKSQLSKVLQKTKTTSKVKPFYNSL